MGISRRSFLVQGAGVPLTAGLVSGQVSQGAEQSDKNPHLAADFESPFGHDVTTDAIHAGERFLDGFA
jgi:hypothetical protein